MRFERGSDLPRNALKSFARETDADTPRGRHPVNWEAVMDVQLDLWKHWQSDVGRTFARGFAQSLRDKGDDAHGGMDLADIEAKKIYQADPISVTEDVLTLVEAAYPTFEIEPLRGSDLLTTHGFVLLPRPYVMRDVSKKRIAIRALAWMPAHQEAVPEQEAEERFGINISMYTYLYDEDDDFNGDILREWQDYRERGGQSRPSNFDLVHITTWWFGQSWDKMAGDLVLPEDEQRAEAGMEGFKSTFQFFQAFLRIAQQTITRSDVRRAPRGQRKRAKREEFEDDPFVTIITLRRHESTGEGSGEPANYSHRFIVRGHWRNQWYPSLGEHRQKWIGGYVKGPEDAELIVKPTRAFEVVR